MIPCYEAHIDISVIHINRKRTRLSAFSDDGENIICSASDHKS